MALSPDGLQRSVWRLPLLPQQGGCSVYLLPSTDSLAWLVHDGEGH